MNILAKEQLKMFEAGIDHEERLLREEKFNELYFKTRRREETNALGKMSLKTRKKLHGLILMIYTIKNHLSGFSYKIIKNESIKTERPIIYAVTHIGKFDIEVVSEAIKEHYYLLSGDYEHLQGTVDAKFLAVNGVIYFNEKVKADRMSVSDRMVEHLKLGGNLMYFPEGTWNLTSELPVLPCYWGIVEIAQRSNAIIVPIAAEQYGKHFKINIGRNFDMQKWGNDNIEKANAINTLRDVLATLKWEIWETTPISNRAMIKDDEWENYICTRFREWPYFNMEYINDLICKPKNVINSKEAFAFMDKLIPSKENAFLFRDNPYIRRNKL